MWRSDAERFHVLAGRANVGHALAAGFALDAEIAGPPSYDVWKDEVSVRTLSSIPVAFRIPFNLPESDLPDMPSRGTMRVSWQLSVSASLPGVDYSAIFDVPVFPTEASDKTFVTGSDSGAAPFQDRT